MYIDLIFELETDHEDTSKQVNGTKSSSPGEERRKRSTTGIRGHPGGTGDRPSSSSSRTPNRWNSQPSSVLPESLATLRPASLPAPSHIRPHNRPRDHVASSSRLQDDSILSRNIRGKQGSNSFSKLVPRTGVYEQELRRLVGADMPSHRGSWSHDNDTWQRFQRGARGTDSPMILEEDENVPNTEISKWSFTTFFAAVAYRCS